MYFAQGSETAIYFRAHCLRKLGELSPQVSCRCHRISETPFEIPPHAHETRLELSFEIEMILVILKGGNAGTTDAGKPDLPVVG
jgi:hypothetical protein